MLLIVLITFLAVGTVLILLLLAGTSGSAAQSKQAGGRLTAALGSSQFQMLETPLDIRRSEHLSTIPIINKLLGKMEIATSTRALLAQADLSWTAGALLLMCILAFAIVAEAMYLRTAVVAFALGMGVLASTMPVLFVFHKRRSRFNQFEKRFPEALDLMVSGLRAGHSLVAALKLVAYETADPVQKEFRICYEEQNYGLDLRVAMENLINRVPLQDLKIVVTAILIQRESGGNLAEILEKTTHVIRERFRLRRQVRTHTAQGRLTGLILSVLPIALGVGLYVLNPKTMSVLWTDPVGIHLMYAAAVSMIIGALVIRKIVNIEV